MQKTVLIVAGGSGKRMGSELPKQFLDLAGKPILIHTMLRFLQTDKDIQITLVLPKAHFAFWEELSKEHLSEEMQARILLAEGGDSRVTSVFSGLSKLNEIVEDPTNCLVAIHDGVRPFVTHAMIEASYQLAEEKMAAVVCMPVKASIRQRTKDGKSRAVDRSHYWEVQTPQTFIFSEIFRAYTDRPHNHFTDDASIFESMVGDVSICEGSYDNIKITSPEDMFVGRGILNRMQGQRQSTVNKDSVKMIILDVDGTLTDGGLYIRSDGNQVRKFNTHDSLGIHRCITRHQVRFGLLSAGTQEHILKTYAESHGVSHYYTGTRPKIEVIQEWLDELNVSWKDIAYIGDDWNDKPALERAGFSACPANAIDELKQRVDVVLTNRGGEGAIRELLEEYFKFDLTT